MATLPLQPRCLVFLTRFLPVALGLGFGIYFVLTSPYRNAPLWSVWAPLLVAFTTTSGVVFPYGLNRWPEVSRYQQVSSREVAPRVTAIVIVALLIIGGTAFIPGPEGSSWRHVALVSTLILGGTPAAAVMEGIRRTARNESMPTTRGQQVLVLVRLRQLLNRLLAAVGSLVALSTLAIGASSTLEQSLPAVSLADAATNLPPQFVLIFGGAGSLLVALFYVPAATALQRRGLRLSDELFPLHNVNEAPAILSAAENRHKLEQLLGVDRGIVADLQTGLAILGPLLAGAAAAFLTPF
ncbi:MAG: hypothetical protein M3O70_27630 [Actinomycetota bacterium]|nr:hypothetical protein [Actinomycetota bacterium]